MTAEHFLEKIRRYFVVLFVGLFGDRGDGALSQGLLELRIGPARLEVMGRAAVKTAILARWNEKPAGVGFVAADQEIAMVHAVEVLANQRRQGVAQWIMRQAAFWAHAQGAETLAVICTRANTPGLSLYSALGFETVGQYHYRAEPETEETHYG